MSNQTSIDRALNALGDPMRRRILERLSGHQIAVGELAGGLPIGRPAVSRHLRVLTDAGLVEHTPHGTRNLYALAPEGHQHLQQWLVVLWDAPVAASAPIVSDPPIATKSASAKPAPKKAAKQKAQKSMARDKKPSATARGKHPAKRAKKKSR